MKWAMNLSGVPRDIAVDFVRQRINSKLPDHRKWRMMVLEYIMELWPGTTEPPRSSVRRGVGSGIKRYTSRSFEWRRH